MTYRSAMKTLSALLAVLEAGCTPPLDGNRVEQAGDGLRAWSANRGAAMRAEWNLP